MLASPRVYWSPRRGRRKGKSEVRVYWVVIVDCFYYYHYYCGFIKVLVKKVAFFFLHYCSFYNIFCSLSFSCLFFSIIRSFSIPLPLFGFCLSPSLLLSLSSLVTFAQYSVKEDLFMKERRRWREIY